MPSPTYSKVVETLGAFVPKEKAAGIVDRQLPKCNATADNLTRAGLQDMMTWLLGAANLYLPDATQKNALKAKLEAL